MMQNQGFVDPGQQGNNQNGMWSPSRAEIGEAGLQRTDVPIPPSTPSTHRSRRGQQQQQQQGSIPVQQPSGNLEVMDLKDGQVKVPLLVCQV